MKKSKEVSVESFNLPSGKLSHTPTPLKVFLGRDYKTEELLLIDENSETTYLCKFLSSDEDKVDYIVRAVNAHDELVALVRRLASSLNSTRANYHGPEVALKGSWYSFDRMIREDIERAEVALAKAEGK